MANAINLAIFTGGATATKVTLSVSKTNPVIGEPVTFTAALKSGATPLSSKSVTIYHYLNGVKYTDTTKTTNAVGQIALVQRFGSAGKRTYYATFNGNSQYAKSQVGPVTVTVLKATTATLTASKTNPAVSQQVTFTAKLYWWNPSAGTWVGLAGKPVTIWHTYKGVRYNDGTKNTDAYGNFTFVQKFGSVGVRYYYATFAGDNTYAAKTTSVLTITVQ